MNRDEFLKGIADGTIKVTSIGGIGVSPSANQEGVVAAAKNSFAALDAAAKGRQFWEQGRLDEAITCFTQSLVIEETNGDLRGVASDLGNIASLYMEKKLYEKASDAFRKALQIDQRVRIEIETLPRKGMANAAMLQDCRLMTAIHYFGLARCSATLNHFLEAEQNSSSALNIFREIQDLGWIKEVETFRAWLATRK